MCEDQFLALVKVYGWVINIINNHVYKYVYFADISIAVYPVVTLVLGHR